jgi:hypothetical protein
MWVYGKVERLEVGSSESEKVTINEGRGYSMAVGKQKGQSLE